MEVILVKGIDHQNNITWSHLFQKNVIWSHIYGNVYQEANVEKDKSDAKRQGGSTSEKHFPGDGNVLSDISIVGQFDYSHDIAMW